MSTEVNKAIVRRYYDEIWSKGDLDLIDELFASNYVNYDPATPGVSVQGNENFKQFIAGYRRAFPDLQMTIEDQVAEGDTVASRWTARSGR